MAELDEAIRSMYKWYSNCQAVVLDSGTTLYDWKSRGWCLQEGTAASALYAILGGKLVTIQQVAKKQPIIGKKAKLCELDLSLYYQPGNAAEIIARMDVRTTTRKEDMAYALTGIFGVHLTLAYGEGYKARERLFKELAVQMGDLSFLSFSGNKQPISNYLPSADDELFLVAQCKEAASPAMVSHFGLTVEVQLIVDSDTQRKLLDDLNAWKDWKCSSGKSMGVPDLITQMSNPDSKTQTSVAIAIVHDIRSIMLLEIHDEDLHTGGNVPIKCCYRLRCCQVEEYEFDRMFGKIERPSERIWLGNQPRSKRIVGRYGRNQQSSRKFMREQASLLEQSSN
jgi:hypothetical protein